MVGILLLLTGILMSGIYALGLKPANTRCHSLFELQLFNGFFSMTAMVGAMIAGLSKGSLAIPPSGLLAAAIFGMIFSLCVFSNLKALEVGPLSITTLIVNFSLIMPLIYSFCFLGEKISIPRVVGIVFLCICMVLFTNPRVTGEAHISKLWLFLSVGSMLCNGALSLIAKIYAMKTDNLYSSQYLFYCYLFATLTSFAICLVLGRNGVAKKTDFRAFFSPMMIFLIVFIGGANFGLNLIVVLLATLMDGAIVYPAIQGGGPMIAAIGSRLIFGEAITWKKWVAILLAITAIVLLNL